MKLLRALFATVLFVGLAGCLDVDTRVLVSADGSGTLTERMVLKGPMAQMIQQMGPDKGGLTDRGKVEEHAKELGEGVRVLSLTEIPKSEGIGAVAVFSFDDVTKLRVKQNSIEGKSVGFDGSKPGSDPGNGKREKPAEMTFRFEPGPPAVLTILMDQSRPPAVKAAPEAPAKSGTGNSAAAEKMMEGVKKMLAGMRMSISVEVSGNIVETNATHRDRNRVTLLEFELDKLMEADPEKAAKLKPGADVEEMKKALADVPGVKIELEREIRVVFMPGTLQARATTPGLVAAPHIDVASVRR